MERHLEKCFEGATYLPDGCFEHDDLVNELFFRETADLRVLSLHNFSAEGHTSSRMDNEYIGTSLVSPFLIASDCKVPSC